VNTDIGMKCELLGSQLLQLSMDGAAIKCGWCCSQVYMVLQQRENGVAIE